MQALGAPIRNTTAQALAIEAVKLAAGGLARRANLNAKGRDETVSLTELQEIAETGLTQAHRLLEKYHGPWKRDITRSFAETLV
jgi:glutamate--cysteine ligase